MDSIIKQIHSAFYNVAQLCDQFFRKYPQHYPPQPGFDPYSTFNTGGYLPQNDMYQPPLIDVYYNKKGIYPPNPNNPKMTQQGFNSKKTQTSKAYKQLQSQQNPSKRNQLQDKKSDKKMQQMRRQRQRLQKQRLRIQQLKMKKKQRNTLKNLIKRDPRYAQRPKFPMSPYFLFLQQMRSNPQTKPDLQHTNHKQFALEMGKQWRRMTQDDKKPYIANYLKEKRGYDQKIKVFYEKFPDLKPRGGHRQDKPMYSVDDPKYQNDSNDINAENNGESNEAQLDNDLIGEIPSEEDISEILPSTAKPKSHNFNHYKMQDKFEDNQDTESTPEEQFSYYEDGQRNLNEESKINANFDDDSLMQPMGSNAQEKNKTANISTRNTQQKSQSSYLNFQKQIDN